MKILELQITDDDYVALTAIGHPVGSTATEIALGAIRQRVREFGRPIVQQILDRYAQDLSVREIAADLGVANNVVRDTLARFGLVAIRKNRPADPRGVSPRSRRITS